MMKPGKLIALVLCLLSIPICALSSDNTDPLEGASTFVDEFKRLYDVEEQGALERFENEIVANDIYAILRSINLPGYAGAWFDSEKASLVVALSVFDSEAIVKDLGALTVAVDYSMQELSALKSEVSQAILAQPDSIETSISVYVDPMVNVVVVEVPDSSVSQIQQILAANFAEQPVTMRVETSGIEFSSLIRGAIGQRNVDWSGSPCSTGITTQDGYYTAGHCGLIGHDIDTPSGLYLGFVDDSTWPSRDAAFVDTTSMWSSSATIQGYSDGILNVPAIWAGVQESAIGTTVCRYGQTSGGPYCGTINLKGYSTYSSWGNHFNLTRLSGGCTDDGDSGGPYIAPSGQVQGTNVGAGPGMTNTCPSPVSILFFQPISDHLDLDPLDPQHVLTTHGSNSPTVNGVSCSHSGPGIYFCTINSYHSQGATMVSMSSSTGASSNALFLMVNCSPSQFVTVTASATNPYGTGISTTNFICSGGPPP